MRISESMVRSYLRDITMGRAANREDPMADLSAYDEAIDLVGERANAEGNGFWLKTAINSLLAQPEGRIGKFAGQGYPFGDDDLIRIFTHTFERIWPDSTPNSGGERTLFEIVQMEDNEWARILAETSDDDDDDDDDA